MRDEGVEVDGGKRERERGKRESESGRGMPGKMGCGGGRQWLVISGPWSVGQSLLHCCATALLD